MLQLSWENRHFYQLQYFFTIQRKVTLDWHRLPTMLFVVDGYYLCLSFWKCFQLDVTHANAGTRWWQSDHSTDFSSCDRNSQGRGQVLGRLRSSFDITPGDASIADRGRPTANSLTRILLPSLPSFAPSRSLHRCFHGLDELSAKGSRTDRSGLSARTSVRRLASSLRLFRRQFARYVQWILPHLCLPKPMLKSTPLCAAWVFVCLSSFFGLRSDRNSLNPRLAGFRFSRKTVIVLRRWIRHYVIKRRHVSCTSFRKDHYRSAITLACIRQSMNSLVANVAVRCDIIVNRLIWKRTTSHSAVFEL
jgi:hypothetical protein